MPADWDVIVVGAGIGGLSTASLLAREGMKVLVVEKEDRVGGRALSLRGEEVSERGADWYRGLLGGQYSYLADCDPPLEEMAAGGLLDGYILDLGFHGVSVAGEGYFATLRDLIGGFGKQAVAIKPFPVSSWIDGQLVEVNIPVIGDMSVDNRLQDEFDRLDVNFLDFFGDLSRLTFDGLAALGERTIYDYLCEIGFVKTADELEKMDSLSLSDHLADLGFTDSKLVCDFFRCLCTLFTTINNPHEISMGDILRYADQVIIPAISNGVKIDIGGYMQNGVMEWPKAVAGRFEELGGEVRLGARVTGVEVDAGLVKGVRVDSGDGEELLPASRVVMGPPIQELYRYVREEDLAGGFMQGVRSLYGYGSLSPYFGLRELPMPEEHAERLILTPCVVPKEEGFDWDVYMAWGIQSYIDPSCAPAGKHLFTAYLPLTEEESRNRELVAKVIKAVPDFLESIYPGFKDCIEWSLYPACWKLEGVAKSVTQAGSLKPEVKAPGVEGLYFAGDTARGYGVAMDCACSSGIICASEITGIEYGIY
ncbi:MAG: NAD(P)/FAD-dependent oxidoreductase [Actinobacteria bacterium]|nr:NAD(P)/FAD-dependent oxidoreductase [Actinomycetota bacterium]